jgi:hypothetical protein
VETSIAPTHLLSVPELIARKDAGRHFQDPACEAARRMTTGRGITGGKLPMSKYGWIVMLMALASPAAADNAVPDLLGTWKGESQSIVLGGSPHHPGQEAGQPRLTSVAFTLV